MKLRVLHRDERGAIMLLAVFMAVFLTGTLYYVLGIGAAIAEREQLQDVADAAAFSAAVIHARGMNVLALINMVMAALLAIVVALQLVETLTTLALATISIMSFFDPALASFVPGLASLRAEVQEAKDAIKPTIDTALDALHAAAIGVRDAVPAASEAQALAATMARADEHVIVLPPLAGLPTEDGTFAELCAHATDYLGDFTANMLGNAVPPLLVGPVKSALSSLVSAGSGWFCGDPHARPPKTKISKPAHYPTLPSRAACLTPDPKAADYDRAAHQRACTRAEDDERASEPNEATGNCETRCEPNGPYEQRDARARESCAPRTGKDALREFDWQERHFVRSFVRRHGLWQRLSDARSEERAAKYQRHNHETERPCGTAKSAIAPDWQRDPHPSGGPELVPVCANACTPPEAAHEGTSAYVNCVEVTRFFGCEEQLEREFSVANDEGDRFGEDDDGAAKRVPQHLRAGLTLGDPDFQLRALAYGPAPSDLAERILNIATWRATPARKPITASARLAVAQAEYFFDVADRKQAPGDYLWSMRWKARFRRVQAPAGAESAADVTAMRRDPLPDCERASNALGLNQESPCAVLQPKNALDVLH